MAALTLAKVCAWDTKTNMMAEVQSMLLYLANLIIY